MKLAWGARVSEAFRQGIIDICSDVGIADPSWLMACIAFESNFDPAARNASSGATGLIQFMPSTARELGTTTEDLAAMSAEAQLAYVADYFAPYKNRLQNFADVYMAILWPKAIGLPDDAVIFPPGSRTYLANRGLDIDHDGAVTRGEAAVFPTRRFIEGLQPGNVYEAPTSPVGASSPAEATSTSPAPVEVPADDSGGRIFNPEQEAPRMGPLMFLPAILDLVPSLIGLFSKGERGERNAKAAQIVVDAFTKAVPGAPNAQAAIEAAQASPAVAKAAASAVMADPAVQALVEVGGGVTEARKFDLAQQAQAKPFWAASAVFWVSVLLLPLVYWLVGSLIVGGIVVGADVPGWMKGLLAIFGTAWNGESRSGGFNLVIGLVLGGICGVYYGVSVTQGRPQQGGTP